MGIDQSAEIGAEAARETAERRVGLAAIDTWQVAARGDLSGVALLWRPMP